MDLKTIAIMLMIADHIGYIINNVYLRILGRLAMPIFIGMLIENQERSKDSRKYLGRLALFALISQFPYRLIFADNLNIFFTLGICLQCLRINKPFYWIGGAIVSQIIKADYGAYGIFFAWSMTGLKLEGVKKDIAWMQVLVINLIEVINSPIQIFSILGVMVKEIVKTESQIKINKWLFYWVYPVHLLVIWIVFP
jgi:hypothetical protein